MSAIGTKKGGFVITGRKMLAAMIGFFGVIIAVNSVFLYFAIDSWPGLTTDRAYVEGLEYNRVLEAAAEQTSRGWTTDLRYDAEDSYLRVAFRGPQGGPLHGLEPLARVDRPLGDTEPVIARLHEVAPGRYEAALPVLVAGRWSVSVAVDERYRMVYELWVTP